MELIKQNPYHVIGVWAGANQRKIAKQKAKINALIKVDKSIDFDTDIELAGKPERSKESIEKAFASIEINQDKLFHALFWFVNNNHIDETALNYLQSNNIDKAKEIWEKITNGKSINHKNFTAFNNLGTLKLALAFSNGTINLNYLQDGVLLKTELITSEYFNEFCNIVADETYNVDQDKELENFINTLLEEVGQEKSEEAKQVPALLSQIHPKLKFLIAEKLTAKPINNIERSIEQTKKQRNENAREAFELARKLYINAKKDLDDLSDILGESDLKYKMIADKLAKEILQCGIDYFQEFRDEEELHEGDLGEDVMKLFKTTKKIAVGTQTKERIDENINGLQEWIDNSEERRKQKLIEGDLKFIISKLEKFQQLQDSIDNADDLVTSCKPKLQNIKSTLGAQDDLYLKLSSSVANNAQDMLVSVFNKAQKNFDLGKSDEIMKLINVFEKIGTLDMMPEFKIQFNKNHNTLKHISSQLFINETFKNSSNRSRASSNKTSMSFNKTRAYSSNSSNYIGCWVFVIIVIIVIIIANIGSENNESSNNNKSRSSYTTSQNKNTDSTTENDSKKEDVDESKKESQYKGNQLKNGTSPYNSVFGKGIYNKDHNNWIKFKNDNSDDDAVVCLVDVSNGRTIRNEYIQAGTTFKMTNIPNGTYYIKVFYGKNWNPNKSMNNGRIKGGFDTDSHFSKSDSYSDRLTLNDDGYQYSTYSVTLYEVINGNMNQQNIDESEFF